MYYESLNWGAQVYIQVIFNFLYKLRQQNKLLSALSLEIPQCKAEFYVKLRINVVYVQCSYFEITKIFHRPKKVRVDFKLNTICLVW